VRRAEKCSAGEKQAGAKISNIFSIFFPLKFVFLLMFCLKYNLTSYQTIWISNVAPHLVWPHLDPNSLQRSSKGHQKPAKFTASRKLLTFATTSITSEHALHSMLYAGQQIRSKIESFQNANFLISQPNPMM